MPLLASVMLCACASQNGRMQLSVPAPVSNAYSEVDLRMRLATAEGTSCEGFACARNREFEQRVERVGAQLAASAYAAHPTLSDRIDRFDFIVADNAEPGSASSASGTVAIYRGVQQLRLDNASLAFVVAREMGHVIDGHHDENSATSILFSVLAQLLLPVTNFLRSAMAMVPGSAPAAAAGTTTAASLAGAQWMKASNRPEQLREADDTALELLASQGWDAAEVAAALKAELPRLGHDNWSDDLRESASRVARVANASHRVAPTAERQRSPIPRADAPSALVQAFPVGGLEEAPPIP